MTNSKTILIQTALVVIFLFFSTVLIIKARGFLIPFSTAVILALLVLPLSRKLELRNMNRATASFINTLLLFLISLGFLALISFQMKNIVDDWSSIKESIQPRMDDFAENITEHFPILKNSIQIYDNDLSMAGSNEPASSAEKAGAFFYEVLNFAGNYLLTFIYIFFVLTYRNHFKAYLLRLFPEEKSDEIKKIISRSATVTQQYLVGKIILIAILAVLYAIGLAISGVENFILISIFAATLSLIPYFGNVIGFGIAMTFGFIGTGETLMLAGIIITFSVAQFVESYFLEPYIVGDRVDLHPFFVILAVIAGNSLWGIMGMILSIPILAIINVILLDIPSLRPFGFLLSNKSPSEK